MKLEGRFLNDIVNQNVNVMEYQAHKKKKTCWMQLPSMEQVGKILRNKYDKAIRVQINDRGNLQLLADETSKERKTRALPTDLVFMDDSPDYCRFDRHSGTLGTEGRVCKRGSSSSELKDAIVYVVVVDTIHILKKSNQNAIANLNGAAK
ncbi:hypothetical protein CRE_07982 [Caenorhabditis remanei]|uniref:Uncharacterized protein n=1 Tax=Caenorhabditis remanei TaxID=31234 RepID=E3NWS8_CAERE|nr:hypothetical protein CRE_07982 [Caenorhabditis remanei]